jgi:hypothetical protein
MNQRIYNYLKEKGILVSQEGDIATNTIKVIEDEVVLSGNKLGLIMLADYMINIALSDNGSHIHLDQDNFFDDGDKQLIIELKE